ncbi:MAG: transglutaminase-like cysteine peptidase [Rubrivivax sp.]
MAAAVLLPASAQAWDAARMAAAAERRGPAAVAALPALQALLREAAQVDDGARLKLVNDFYNHRITFQTDLQVWGQEDYWASPLESLQQGRGDCEDYAIAKYATLLAAGVAPQRLQLVYVRARMPGLNVAQPHMVLAVHGIPAAPTAALAAPTTRAGTPSVLPLALQTADDPAAADPLVLDNLRPEVLRASQRPDLIPVFSFNAEGLWQGSQPAGDPLVRLSRWREVWLRTREEGFP